MTASLLGELARELELEFGKLGWDSGIDMALINKRLAG